MSRCLLLLSTGAALTLGGIALVAPAATLTLTPNVLGPTPEILAYNSGHFITASNTKDWWRYSGVNGARVFLAPSEIEPSDDLAPVGDGVTDAGSFLARKAALRADPLNPAYINWGGSGVFSNRYESNDLYPNNHIVPNYTFREMRRLGIQICAQLTASQSRWPLAGTNDWPNMWELWQNFYAQAFYLGRVFDVERYQVFNEPNHPNANGLSITNHLLRLQLASDAVQAALADVNARYGKSLVPKMLAPVTSGSADGSYAGWGESVVTNRHLNFLGQTDPGCSLIHVYDYHQYGSAPATFGSDLAALHSFLSVGMTPEPRYPTAISEFNTDTGANFDTQAETLDTPAKYSRFGAIVVNLLANGISELYAFKFSQTERDPPTTYPVAKNAMHYVDNLNSPYHVGGITKAGEVYRLFQKAFAAGRTRLDSIKGSGATSFDVHASYDPARQRYHLFSVNNTSTGVAIELAFPTLPVPAGNRVLLEEVSETAYGTVRLWTNVPPGRAIAAAGQGSNSIWLLTLPVAAQTAEQTIVATDDAEVRDGANQHLNYGAAANLLARNDPANTANRSAVLMKFKLGNVALTNLEFALLSLQAATTTSNTTVQAHVYALAATNWSQDTITWATAPNLRQNVAAGNTIARQCVSGAGDTAFIVGQLVTTSTNVTEQLLDVTDWLRGFTNTTVSFLVSQDPRWDVTLPSLATGDTQAEGIRITANEGGLGPRLRLVMRAGPPTNNNTPPFATNDVFVTTEDTPLVIAAPGVLANDFDAETNSLTAVLVANVAHGTLALNPNGGFTYTPANNYFGPDGFSYTANDGSAGSAPAPVSLTVTSVNDAPIAANDSATTPQNTAVVINVLTNDSDPDGGTLTLIAFTQPTNGVAVPSGGGLVYSPFNGFRGSDGFNYAIADGQGGTNSASVSVTVTPAGGSPFWTNLLVATEAFVRGGASATQDQDEVTTGYLMVKYNASPFDTSRKAYFQFDLAGLSLAPNTPAVFTVSFQANFKQNVQLWALNQAFLDFAPTLTWNTAQANDTESNNLLGGGAFNATTVGVGTNIPTSGTSPVSLAVPAIGNYVLGNRVTLAMSGSPDAGSFVNNSGGLRMLRTNATLRVLVSPSGSPPSSPAPVITRLERNADGGVTLTCSGATNRVHFVQVTSNLVGGVWLNLSTNFSGFTGAWIATDAASTNLPQRYYRAVLP